MINCDRCGLHKEGQSSICKDEEEKYEIISGYDSKFDGIRITLNGEYENLEKLKEKFLWLQNIGENFDNICDDCVFNMIQIKEAKMQDNEGFSVPFYTACCDKFITAMTDQENFYKISKEKRFPYLSYYAMYNCMKNYWDELDNGNLKYVSDDDLFFDYYEQCTICVECLNKSRQKLSSVLEMDNDNPVCHTLHNLINRAKSYLEFELRDYPLTENSCKNGYTKDEYIKVYYKYLSRKNNLEIKKELSIYLMSRNLNIMREYLFISKDIFNYILKK